MKSLYFEIRNTIRIRERRVFREAFTPVFELAYNQVQAAPYFEIVTQKPDSVVIQGIKNLDNDMFNYLYLRLFREVKSKILQNKGNSDIAKDIFQETMADIFEQAKMGKLNIKSSVEGYIVTIAVRKWNKIISKSIKNKELTIDESFTIDKIHPMIDPLEPTDNFDVISGWIDELSDVCINLINEFYYKSRNWDSIASDYGYKNARSASNQKYKCLEILRIKLDAKRYNL